MIAGGGRRARDKRLGAHPPVGARGLRKTDPCLVVPFGGPAASRRPAALRPCPTAGLPLSGDALGVGRIPVQALLRTFLPAALLGAQDRRFAPIAEGRIAAGFRSSPPPAAPYAAVPSPTASPSRRATISSRGTPLLIASSAPASMAPDRSGVALRTATRVRG